MVRSGTARCWFVILLFAGLLCCHSQRCSAQTITITEQQPLRFGVLQTPGGGPETFTVDPAGATSGSGTLLYGTVSQGIYKIRCAASCAALGSMISRTSKTSAGCVRDREAGFGEASGATLLRL